MGRYLLKRVFAAGGVMAALVTLVFLAAFVIGDPLSLQYDPELNTEAELAELRAALGYDRPLAEQFGDYLGGLLRGDLGRSVTQRRAATEVVLDRLPATALLASTATAIAMALAIPLALLSARRPGWIDQSITTVCTAFASLPSFWFALALVFVFAARVSWLPTGGYGGPRELVLPAIALAAVPLGHMTLLLASTMRAEFGSQYVTVARAKGLGEWKLSLRHVLPNASLVLATQVGFLLATLLSGTVLIETVFAWPGLGSLGLEAVQQRDLPLVMATVIYIGAIVIAINLVVDLAYARLDPRVRLA